MQLYAPRESNRRPCRHSSCRPKGGPRRRHVPSHWAHARESTAPRRSTRYNRSRQRWVGALVNRGGGASSRLKGSNRRRWRRAARNGWRCHSSSHLQIRGRDLALKALRCRRGHGTRPCRPRKHPGPFSRSRRECFSSSRRFRREREIDCVARLTSSAIPLQDVFALTLGLQWDPHVPVPVQRRRQQFQIGLHGSRDCPRGWGIFGTIRSTSTERLADTSL